ncbi:MAG TPA: glycoside hydrolase family 16 protein [Acidimicrobiales bacterium]|nr:glycoside hydrolase family 16 protein [Acidimicrobiales bacterium]
MTNAAEAAPVSPSPNRHSPWNARIAVITVVTASLAIVVTVLFAINSSGNDTFQPRAHNEYPIGVKSNLAPSGEGPPGPSALTGYNLTYVNNFEGTSIPPGWNVFTGIPAGSPGGQFASTHVVVSDGLLQLNTWKDPNFQNRWVTGGICQCGLKKSYGAYFVRSRITGAGPNEVELLWPASNIWPPEIDFNETGGTATATSSTLHYGPINLIEQRFINIDMKNWHTWGVIWSPKQITYIVDGQVWGTITAAEEITSKPMTLDFEQRQLCEIHQQCPTHPVSMLIDWVAEYSAK